MRSTTSSAATRSNIADSRFDRFAEFNRFEEFDWFEWSDQSNACTIAQMEFGRRTRNQTWVRIAAALTLLLFIMFLVLRRGRLW